MRPQGGTLHCLFGLVIEFVIGNKDGREGIGTIGGIGIIASAPMPMVPMSPMLCSWGPASRSLHPIFQLPLGASGRNHQHACP
jgi:hypothetical protein